MIQPALPEALQQSLHARLAGLPFVGGEKLRFSLLSEASVADGTTVVLVSDLAARPRAVVLCSSSLAPGMVERAMSRAREAKSQLGHATGSAILDPLDEGRLQGLSYAVLPHCDRLSDARLFWWFQRARLRPALFDWLWHVNERTVVDVDPGEEDVRFGQPLRHLASLAVLSERLRSSARQAEQRLNGGLWIPRHVLMHGDLWKGNVLLRSNEKGRRPRSWNRRFVVIDWPGSELRGYAIYDLVRLAQSMRIGRRTLRYELGRHCDVLRCQPVDAKSHLLAALGHIAMNLESFPVDIFAGMAEECLATIESASE